MNNLLSAVILLYLVVAVSVFASPKLSQKIQEHYQRAVSLSQQKDADETDHSDHPAYTSRKYDSKGSLPSGIFYWDSDKDGLSDDLDTQPFDSKRY